MVTEGPVACNALQCPRLEEHTAYRLEPQLVLLHGLAGDADPGAVCREDELGQPPSTGVLVEVGARVRLQVRLRQHLARHAHAGRVPARSLRGESGA